VLGFIPGHATGRNQSSHPQPQFFLEPSEMEAASPAHGGAGGGAGGGGHSGGSTTAGDGEEAVFDNGLDELWPTGPSSAAQRLAQMWEANPQTSARWTSGLGGVE
jgi:hypothetical protein